MELKFPFEFNFGPLGEYLEKGIPLKINRVINKGEQLTKFAIVNPRLYQVLNGFDTYYVDIVYFYKDVIDVRSGIVVQNGYVSIDKRKIYIGPFNDNTMLKNKINNVFNDII